MHERFPAKYSEKNIPVRLGVIDRSIQQRQINRVLLLHIHPAPLAAQITRIDDREIKERRENLAALEAALEFLHRQHPLEAKVPRKLPDTPEIGGTQCAV